MMDDTPISDAVVSNSEPHTMPPNKTSAFRALLAAQRGTFTSRDLIGHTDPTELFAMLCKFESRCEIECIGLTQPGVANKRLKIYRVRHLLLKRPVRTYIKRNKSAQPELPENVRPWAELWPSLFTLPKFITHGTRKHSLLDTPSEEGEPPSPSPARK